MDYCVSNEEGSSSCSICPVGTYEYNHKFCYKCGEGYYSNKTGATGCIECDDGYIADEEGCTSCSSCPV